MKKLLFFFVAVILLSASLFLGADRQQEGLYLVHPHYDDMLKAKSLLIAESSYDFSTDNNFLFQGATADAAVPDKKNVIHKFHNYGPALMFAETGQSLLVSKKEPPEANPIDEERRGQSAYFGYLAYANGTLVELQTHSELIKETASYRLDLMGSRIVALNIIDGNYTGLAFDSAATSFFSGKLSELAQGIDPILNRLSIVLKQQVYMRTVAGRGIFFLHDQTLWFLEEKSSGVEINSIDSTAKGFQIVGTDDYHVLLIEKENQVQLTYYAENRVMSQVSSNLFLDEHQNYQLILDPDDEIFYIIDMDSASPNLVFSSRFMYKDATTL